MVGPAQQGKRPVVMALCTRDDAVASGRWQDAHAGHEGASGVASGNVMATGTHRQDGVT
jgi:hypothetical protein